MSFRAKSFTGLSRDMGYKALPLNNHTVHAKKCKTCKPVCLPCYSLGWWTDPRTSLQAETKQLSVVLSVTEMFVTFWCQTMNSDLGEFFWIWKQWEVNKNYWRLDIFLICGKTYWIFGYFFFSPCIILMGKLFLKSSLLVSHEILL